MNAPHIPATCPACYALLSAPEQRIADIVRRLVADAPTGTKWFTPERTAICEREGEQE